jgi:ParB/RepB/Spo0J family partition protein
MSKKDLLNNFFDGNQQTITPNSPVLKKKYTSHKLFDNPDSTPLNQEHIVEIDTNNIYISPHKVDRASLDEIKLSLLAENILAIGQLQPCTVRRNPKGGKEYELIFGERRFRAAILKGLKVKVVVQDIDLYTSALALLSENRNREDNTDYDLSRQITEFINSDILKQIDIVKKTGISKQKISKLLCFNKIPKEIIDGIEDLRKVSASTAECISKLSTSAENIKAILSISNKISSGEYGHSKITSHIESYKNKLERNTNTSKQYTENGRHLFTIRHDNNNNPSIHFPVDILKLISSGKIQENGLKECLSNFLEENINKIPKVPQGTMKEASKKETSY